MNLKTVWKELHNLNAQETDLIKRFESDPFGPLFVTAAEILRKRGYLDECIVLLEDGLKKFPQFHSARAALGRDYYFKGMMPEALTEIEIVITRNPENLMAQRLRMKLALIFDDRPSVIHRLNILKQLSTDDEFSRILRDLVSIDDWRGAQNLVFSELKKLGIQCDLEIKNNFKPKSETNVSSAEPIHTLESWELPKVSNDQIQSIEQRVQTNTQAMRDTNKKNKINEISEDTNQNYSEYLPPIFRPGNTLSQVRGDNDRYLALKGFRVVSTSGLFVNGGVGGLGGGLESSTLAEIYVTQGMYSKAAEIYEKLLRESPEDISLQKKLISAQELVRQNLSKRVNIPEKRAIIPEKDRKLKVLESLLDKLEGKMAQSEEFGN